MQHDGQYKNTCTNSLFTTTEERQAEDEADDLNIQEKQSTSGGARSRMSACPSSASSTQASTTEDEPPNVATPSVEVKTMSAHGGVTLRRSIE